MGIRIAKFDIRGFKSLQSVQLDAGQVNVFIGPNGAGKSNLIAFFRMLSWMVKSPDRFQEHIGSLGWASAILFDGPRVTPEISGLVVMDTPRGLNEYAFRLARSGQDQLFFAEEKVRFSRADRQGANTRWADMGFGHAKSHLAEMASSNNTVRSISFLLKGIFVYQFHDTSQTADIRSSWSILDGKHLKENAANLGSFLHNLQQNHSHHYERIVHYIQSVLPFFDTFDFVEDRGRVLLQWREIGSNQTFFAGQASDGMLRMIALVSLLAQPPQNLPPVMFIDEPELGLHPTAIAKLGGLIKKASNHAQIFISTQSVTLLNEFDPEDVIVVERGAALNGSNPDGAGNADGSGDGSGSGSGAGNADGSGDGSGFRGVPVSNRATTLRRLNPELLKGWLSRFSLGELWERNILGGRP